MGHEKPCSATLGQMLAISSVCRIEQLGKQLALCGLRLEYYLINLINFRSKLELAPECSRARLESRRSRVTSTWLSTRNNRAGHGDVIESGLYKAIQINAFFHLLTTTTMPHTLTKVIYKPDTQSTDEFTIIVNPEQVRKSRRSFIISSLKSSPYSSTRSGKMEVSMPRTNYIQSYLTYIIQTRK